MSNRPKLEAAHDREAQEFAQRIVEEAWIVQGIMDYLFENNETGYGLAELCHLIDRDFPQLAVRLIYSALCRNGDD